MIMLYVEETASETHKGSVKRLDSCKVDKVEKFTSPLKFLFPLPVLLTTRFVET